MNTITADEIRHMSSNTGKRILLVEDDEHLSALTSEYLTGQGYEVDCIDNGLDAVAEILENRHDLVLLDLMIPGIDGIEVCRRVRDSFINPIVMITAKDEDLDQILGLEIGADDYLQKPVKPRVLLAKVKSYLRLLDRLPAEKEITEVADQPRKINGKLMIDSSRRIVECDGCEVELSTPEFDLLWIFFENIGTTLSRDDIFNKLSGIEYDGQNRRIDILVSKLRGKIDDDDSDYIKTVRGKGYLFVPHDKI